MKISVLRSKWCSVRPEMAFCKGGVRVNVTHLATGTVFVARFSSARKARDYFNGKMVCRRMTQAIYAKFLPPMLLNLVNVDPCHKTSQTCE